MGLMDKMKDATSQVMAEAKQNLAYAKDTIGAEQVDNDPQVELADEPRPLYEVVSHIAGKNALVRLWPDRIEWQRGRGVSGGKITAGIMTGGLSLLATGVKGGKDASDMVFLRKVTNVSNRKDGILYHLVEVQTASGGAVNAVQFRVNREEAAQFRQAILGALQALEERASAPVVVQVAAAPPAPAPVADLAAQLHQLAGLRDAGILTEEEFAAKKVEILARM
jgi:hypothetical protein